MGVQLVSFRGEDPVQAITRPGGWFVGSRVPEIIVPGFGWSIVSGVGPAGAVGAKRPQYGNLSGGPQNIIELQANAAGSLGVLRVKAGAGPWGATGARVTFQGAVVIDFVWVGANNQYENTGAAALALRNLFQAKQNVALGFNVAANP